MLNNDRHDEHIDHEESEYHFSDDDVSYEVETESAKPIPGETKENILNRLTSSKRMIITLVVFVGLIFIVYKMITPTTTTPITEITPPVTSAPQPTLAAQAPVVTQPQTPTPAEVAAPAPVQAPVAPAPVAVAPAPIQPAAQPTEPPVIAVAPPAPAPMTAPPATAVVPASPMPPAPTTSPVTQVASVPPPATVAPAPVAAAPMQAPVATMPAVIPVESNVTTYTVQQTPTAAPIAQVAATASTSGLEVTNTKLIAQMQADYSQKLNEYAAQNKSVADQMQALSARVATMEAQLNQLVQTLTRPPAPVPAPAFEPRSAIPAPPVVMPEPKVSFSVQAIIPGRAWLKSDSGDTVTVAEGDVIKDLGRVTKIDPYDGVVEVNTGSKTVSISYGNGS